MRVLKLREWGALVSLAVCLVAGQPLVSTFLWVICGVMVGEALWKIPVVRWLWRQ